MDSDNEDDVQNVDNEADHVVQECLRNPVIVREILENSSSPELFKLSLVNKLWKKEARIMLGKRGRFTAFFSCHTSLEPSQQVDAFISDLKEMNPVPYSGISMEIFVESRTDPFPVGALDPVQGLVFDQSSLRVVSVTLQGKWSENMASPGARLVKKVLQDSSDVLQELSLFISQGGGDFIEKFVQDISFPRLQILKLLEHRLSGINAEKYQQYVKEMLSRAPNIKTLHINWSINLLLSILKERSVLPVYTHQVDALFDEISENVISKIRFENIKFVYTGPEFNLDRFNRIAPMLLQESCSTALRYVHLDAVLALSLMIYGISLKKVKFLTIDINHRQLERSEPRLLSVVKGLDFTRIFPNLKKVVISPVIRRSPGHMMNIIIEHATAVLREPMPDRANNIKVLSLHDGYLSSLAVQFFSEMFPSIEELHIIGTIPYEVIWKSGLDLKKLTVEGILRGAAGNLDSVFCGIFPEEVAELREKDEDYLMRVNIVPVMPAITCLKNLRTLAVHVHHWHNRDDPPNDDDATFMFSKVTALIAFGRLPALAVSVNISVPGDPPAMTHLKPYVSVTQDGLPDWRRKIRRSTEF